MQYIHDEAAAAHHPHSLGRGPDEAECLQQHGAKQLKNRVSAVLAQPEWRKEARRRVLRDIELGALLCSEKRHVLARRPQSDVSTKSLRQLHQRHLQGVIGPRIQEDHRFLSPHPRRVCQRHLRHPFARTSIDHLLLRDLVHQAPQQALFRPSNAVGSVVQQYERLLGFPRKELSRLNGGIGQLVNPLLALLRDYIGGGGLSDERSLRVAEDPHLAHLL
mmetsp:Transcript_2226/g.4143  ORF Transcript_2226/g.4143 Transcript_2226/m.4143 type:complete len:219 (-) Transcript_2226:497-1153(-)